MARNPVTADAINCPSCGAKIRTGHRRCPRCRAAVASPHARSWSISKKGRRRIGAGVVAIAIGGLGLPWLERGAPAQRSGAPTRGGDPLQARRPASAGSIGAPRAAEPMSDRSFVEPAAAGHAAYSDGNYESALAHFKAAVERNPNDPDGWSNMGQVLVRLNRVTEAIPCFTRAIAIVPDRWTYHFNLARAHGLLEQWDAAVGGYRRAAQLFPDDYVTTFNLGLALHKRGDDAEAVEAYQKAIALAPGDASFRMALGISYERLQKTSEAAAAYAEYLRLAPQAVDADKVRGRIEVLTSQVSSASEAPTGQKPTGG